MNYQRQINLSLESAEWIISVANDLIIEYQKCRTKKCKKIVENKLRAIQGKLNYENKLITKIIGEANNERI